jgi:hypothetical protein
MKTLLLILALAMSASAQDFLKTKGVSSVAILPVVGESVPQAVRDAAGKKAAAVLLKHVPDLRVTDAADSAAVLEHEARLEDLASFLNLFVKTGTVNTAALSRCGMALEKHLLLVEVQEYTERGGSWLRSRSGQNTARIQYTLFTKDGEQVWQTLESLHRSQLTTTVAPMEEIIERVSERAISALVKGEEHKDVKQKRGGRVIL